MRAGSSRSVRVRLACAAASLLLCGVALAGEGATAPADLVRDPDFRALVKYQLELKQKHLATFAELSASQRQSLLDKADRAIEGDESDDKAIMRLAADYGFRRGELKRLRVLTERVTEKYPELLGENAPNLVEAALFGDPDVAFGFRFCLFCIEYEIHSIDPNYERDPCAKECHDEFIKDNKEITGSNILALFGCAAPNLIPLLGTAGSVACYAKAQITVARLATAAAEEYDRCLKECNEASESETRVGCKSHSDCGKDEYCFLFDGTFTTAVPKPYCRKKRSEKAECQFDYECKTGCCKFYGWWSISHDVCRPASKC